MIADEVLVLTPERIRSWLASHAAEGSCAVQQERRLAPRWPLGGVVELWPAGTPSRGSCFATCRDMSETGLGLICSRRFAPGTRVEIAIYQSDAALHGFGLVRHCRQDGAEYLVGIEFLFND